MSHREKSGTYPVWLWISEIVLGILLMGSVFLIASNQDMADAQQHLSGTVSYIKEQCNQYNRLNLASETKSLMRIMESARYMERELSYLEEQNPSFTVDEAYLKKMVQDNYVTGVLLLDPDGTVLQQYHSSHMTEEELREHLDSGALLDTAQVPEKVYSIRFAMEDDSYVDLAAVGRADGNGIIVAYYDTPAEYVQAFNLTIDTLLSGYSLEHDGTIVVSSGDRIVASNDEKLIGESTNDIEILKKIKSRAASDHLVHAKREEVSPTQNFGLMEHGREYYVYAYMPEKEVFDSTLQYVFYSMILYAVLLIAINMVRWKTAQGYRERQIRLQEEYTQRLQSTNE